MEVQGDSLIKAPPLPAFSANLPEDLSVPVWDADQLRLAVAAAGGRTLVVERRYQSIHDGRESFSALGRPAQQIRDIRRPFFAHPSGGP